ncbi:MAG TPA: hypothetical protein VFC45_05225 [Pseudolabrys sp.]|nr:hypothetical protein [Pseudolabrys sp.]
MSKTQSLETILAGQLADSDSHWGLGSFGAIAEFTRDHDEHVTLDLAALSAVTARGGIRIAPSADLRAVAFETAAGSSWNQNVALCLPADRAAMHRRTSLTEIGRDAEALREEDKTSVLFDLGLGIPHVDACVRVRDSAVAEQLRTQTGKNVFAPDSGAMRVVLAGQPHRVFMSRCGRVEVYQPIPPPDGRSPQGPHTHVLPKLLSAGRTHAATEPIPEDLVPCLSIYPAHPAKDALGRTKPFQADRHDAFQVLLRWFGDPAMIRLKTAVAAALAGGEAPRRVENGDRFARVWIRIALRQAQASGMKSPALDLWRERYERPGSQDHNEDHSDISGCH